MRSHFSHVRLFVTLWTVAHQARSMGFSRQEYWSGLPLPSPGDLPGPGIKPASSVSPELQGDSLPLTGEYLFTILLLKNPTLTSVVIYFVTHNLDFQLFKANPVLRMVLNLQVIWAEMNGILC